MKRFLHSAGAFSLVEVTLALGVAGFCLLALLALLPIGVQTNQRSISQTAATAILSNVVSDLRATSKATASPTPSQLYKINIPASGGANTTPQTLYFDDQGQFANSLAPPSPTPFQPRYRLTITFPQSSPTPASSPVNLPTYADLKITWPAAIDPLATQGNGKNATPPPIPGGSSEMFAAFNRN